MPSGSTVNNNHNNMKMAKAALQSYDILPVMCKGKHRNRNQNRFGHHQLHCHVQKQILTTEAEGHQSHKCTTTMAGPPCRNQGSTHAFGQLSYLLRAVDVNLPPMTNMSDTDYPSWKSRRCILWRVG